MCSEHTKHHNNRASQYLYEGTVEVKKAKEYQKKSRRYGCPPSSPSRSSYDNNLSSDKGNCRSSKNSKDMAAFVLDSLYPSEDETYAWMTNIFAFLIGYPVDHFHPG